MNFTIEMVKNKPIGKVVYIVEGGRKELSLLNHIFTDILDYSTINVPRNKDPFVKYESKSDINSRVFLISAKNSNIKHIDSETGKQYLDKVYKTLFEKYNIDLTNSATFYIFDRDPKSNEKARCEQLISILKNSRDNGIEGNGILLLSYPCVEAYIKSCIDNTINESIDSSRKMKVAVSSGEYQYDKIAIKEVEFACMNMLFTLSNISGKEWDERCLDDFAEISQMVFEKEENFYTGGAYRVLSLLSISFLDLGLINIKMS
ncbi:MAG: hypothetical protein IJY07_00415 [Clostridia bacterium]|nr:hypothetical protein [Clostridia bacterium]